LKWKDPLYSHAHYFVLCTIGPEATGPTSHELKPQKLSQLCDLGGVLIFCVTLFFLVQL
jgi:hypothetical protein